MSEVWVWGKPSAEKKAKLDYHPEKIVMTIIQPQDGEKNTNLLFNSKATEALKLKKDSVVSVSFKPINLVANLTELVQEADGKKYFSVHAKNSWKGLYFTNKPISDELAKNFNLVFEDGLAHLELESYDTTDFIGMKIIGQISTTANYAELITESTTAEEQQ